MGRWDVAAGAVVCAEQLLVASLVGVSLPQHSSQLALQLLQLVTREKKDNKFFVLCRGVHLHYLFCLQNLL